jgi:hypothetical protein
MTKTFRGSSTRSPVLQRLDEKMTDVTQKYLQEEQLQTVLQRLLDSVLRREALPLNPHPSMARMLKAVELSIIHQRHWAVVSTVEAKTKSKLGEIIRGGLHMSAIDGESGFLHIKGYPNLWGGPHLMEWVNARELEVVRISCASFLQRFVEQTDVTALAHIPSIVGPGVFRGGLCTQHVNIKLRQDVFVQSLAFEKALHAFAKRIFQQLIRFASAASHPEEQPLILSVSIEDHEARQMHERTMFGSLHPTQSTEDQTTASSDSAGYYGSGNDGFAGADGIAADSGALPFDTSACMFTGRQEWSIDTVLENRSKFMAAVRAATVQHKNVYVDLLVPVYEQSSSLGNQNQSDNNNDDEVLVPQQAKPRTQSSSNMISDMNGHTFPVLRPTRTSSMQSDTKTTVTKRQPLSYMTCTAVYVFNFEETEPNTPYLVNVLNPSLGHHNGSLDQPIDPISDPRGTTVNEDQTNAFSNGQPPQQQRPQPQSQQHQQQQQQQQQQQHRHHRGIIRSRKSFCNFPSESVLCGVFLSHSDARLCAYFLQHVQPRERARWWRGSLFAIRPNVSFGLLSDIRRRIQSHMDHGDFIATSQSVACGAIVQHWCTYDRVGDAQTEGIKNLASLLIHVYKVNHSIAARLHSFAEKSRQLSVLCSRMDRDHAIHGRGNDTRSNSRLQQQQRQSVGSNGTAEYMVRQHDVSQFIWMQLQMHMLDFDELNPDIKSKHVSYLHGLAHRVGILFGRARRHFDGANAKLGYPPIQLPAPYSLQETAAPLSRIFQKPAESRMRLSTSSTSMLPRALSSLTVDSLAEEAASRWHMGRTGKNKRRGPAEPRAQKLSSMLRRCQEDFHRMFRMFQCIGESMSKDVSQLSAEYMSFVMEASRASEAISSGSVVAAVAKEFDIDHRVIPVALVVEAAKQDSRIPEELALEVALSRYVVDTEIDQFIREALNSVLLNPTGLPHRPYQRLVIESDAYSMRYEGWQESDALVLRKIEHHTTPEVRCSQSNMHRSTASLYWTDSNRAQRSVWSVYPFVQCLDAVALHDLVDAICLDALKYVPLFDSSGSSAEQAAQQQSGGCSIDGLLHVDLAVLGETAVHMSIGTELDGWIRQEQHNNKMQAMTASALRVHTAHLHAEATRNAQAMRFARVYYMEHASLPKLLYGFAERCVQHALWLSHHSPHCVLFLTAGTKRFPVHAMEPNSREYSSAIRAIAVATQHCEDISLTLLLQVTPETFLTHEPSTAGAGRQSEKTSNFTSVVNVLGTLLGSTGEEVPIAPQQIPNADEVDLVDLIGGQAKSHRKRATGSKLPSSEPNTKHRVSHSSDELWKPHFIRAEILMILHARHLLHPSSFHGGFGNSHASGADSLKLPSAEAAAPSYVRIPSRTPNLRQRDGLSSAARHAQGVSYLFAPTEVLKAIGHELVFLQRDDAERWDAIASLGAPSADVTPRTSAKMRSRSHIDHICTNLRGWIGHAVLQGELVSAYKLAAHLCAHTTELRHLLPNVHRVLARTAGELHGIRQQCMTLQQIVECLVPKNSQYGVADQHTLGQLTQRWDVIKGQFAGLRSTLLQNVVFNEHASVLTSYRNLIVGQIEALSGFILPTGAPEVTAGFCRTLSLALSSLDEQLEVCEVMAVVRAHLNCPDVDEMFQTCVSEVV